MIHSVLWQLRNPASVQAYCAVLGVIGLFIYAWDNKRSANYSREQIEEPSIPFVTIDVPTNRSRFAGHVFVLMNVGNGPALNVFLSGEMPGQKVLVGPAAAAPEWHDWRPRRLPYGVVAAGDDAQFDHFVNVAIGEQKTLTIEYQSLSGRRYRTVITRFFGGNAAFGRVGWTVQFERPDNPAPELRRFSRPASR